jgi:hypothetical protein
MFIPSSNLLALIDSIGYMIYGYNSLLTSALVKPWQVKVTTVCFTVITIEKKRLLSEASGFHI